MTLLSPSLPVVHSSSIPSNQLDSSLSSVGSPGTVLPAVLPAALVGLPEPSAPLPAARW